MKKIQISLLLLFVMSAGTLTAGYPELFRSGETLRNERKFVEAQAVFRQASAEPGLTPDQKAIALLRTAQCDFWRGKPAEALPLMKEAEATPGITSYYRCDANMWIGDAYRALKQYDNAVAAYEQAVKFAPASLPMLKFSAWMNAALCCKAQENYPKAIACLKQAAALEKIPQQQQTRALLEIPKYCMAARDYPAAIDAARTLTTRANISAADRKAAQTLIGKAHFAMQQFDKAAEELKKAETMPEK